MFYTKLNALRGIAAFFVAAFHYVEPYDGALPLFLNSAIFVDLFFVLSGFVIYKCYQQGIHDRVIGLSEFAFLRLLRLYPVHFLIMLVWLAYVSAKILVANRYGIGDPENDGALVWLFFENLFLINAFGISGQSSWNFPTWSVSAELFAYLAFFAFVTMSRDMACRKRSLVYQAVLVSISLYALLYSIGLHQKHPELVYRHFDFGFIRAAAGFFAGAALAQADLGRFAVQRGYIKDTVIEVFLVAAALWLVTVSDGSFVLQAAMVPVFCVIIGCFSGTSRGLVSWLLESSVLQRFGLISYSFYLWHIFVFLFMTDVFEFVLKAETNIGGYVEGDAKWVVIGISFALTCVLSSVTFRLVEEPARRWSKTFAKSRFRRLSAKGTAGSVT